MKQSKRIYHVRRVLAMATGLMLAVMGNNLAQAYSTYTVGTSGGCFSCHGDFRSSPSLKGTVFSGSPANNHNMHRNVMSIQNQSCVLCHTSPDDVPVFIGSSDGAAGVTGMGCSGCHVGSGLRKHHVAKAPTANCYSTATGCHHNASETVPAENVNSPHYDGKTAYTRVQNPSNTLQVANTNENWSVGDFWGVDNDGNGLADLADYTIGPRESILSATRVGNDFRITWQTAGGRTNTVQAAGNVSGTYSNISSAIIRTNAGLYTTNYLQVGGATNGARFYRTKVQ